MTPEQMEAREKLLTCLSPGQTVYTIERHRTAKSRSISIVSGGALKGQLDLYTVDGFVCRLLGHRFDRRWDGVVCEGAAELVIELGRALWPEGTPKPHSQLDGKPNNSGAYALRQCAL